MASSAGGGLAADAAVVDITPPAGCPMGGYVERQPGATGVRDELLASLVWLTDPDVNVLWVAVDALGLDADFCARLRRRVGAVTGIDADSVIIGASHTHSGPSGWLAPLYDGFPSCSDEALRAALLDAVTGAAGRLRPRPVQARWAVTDAVGVAGDRNAPVRRHGDTSGVLTLHGAAGPIAVLADYACHPTVLGADNLRYSADFPGAARRAVVTSGEPVVAFLQGAAGDLSTRFTRREQSFTEADRLGGILGAAIGRAVECGRPLTGPLRMRRSTVTLPVRRMPSAAAVDAAVVETERAWRVATETASPAVRIAQTRYEGARMLAALSRTALPPALELPLSAVILDDVGWVYLPVEPFASYGAAIVAASPLPDTRVIGYADGYFGYLADAAAHAGGSYEARASLFDADAGRLVVDAALALLNHR